MYTLPLFSIRPKRRYSRFKFSYLKFLCILSNSFYIEAVLSNTQSRNWCGNYFAEMRIWTEQVSTLIFQIERKNILWRVRMQYFPQSYIELNNFSNFSFVFFPYWITRKLCLLWGKIEYTFIFQNSCSFITYYGIYCKQLESLTFWCIYGMC